MKNHLFAVCLVVFGALCVRAEIRPACTVTFADLPTIADNVASLGKGTFDPVLTQLVPAAIRNQGAAKLFGAMRPGSQGVAVCYVDSAKLAHLMRRLNSSSAVRVASLGSNLKISSRASGMRTSI